MRDVFTGFGFLLWGLGRFTILTVAALARALWRGVRQVAAGLMPLAGNVAAGVPASTAVQAAAPGQGPWAAAPSSGYAVADRIASVRLDPPVGVINLRIYNAARLVRRDLVVTEPRLIALMCGRRHSFPDVVYDPARGLDTVKTDTVALAEQLINMVGNQSELARPGGGAQARPKCKAAPAAPVMPVPEVVDAIPLEPSSADCLPEATARGGACAVPAPARITYIGRLIAARTETVTPTGRRPYETFQATVLLDTGVEMPLRGAELERELTNEACEVGHLVAITALGKVPVALTNGGEGRKNLYQVHNLSLRKGGAQ